MGNYLNDPKIAVYDGSRFSLNDYKCDYTDGLEYGKSIKKKLKRDQNQLHDYQRMMFATDRHSVLLVFQAMDAAGKDSTIRHVFSGMFPQAVQVHSFKAPSSLELDHDYLWRTQLCLPERGKFAIYNRSHYEEVLVTRVHPEYILGQRIPHINELKDVDDVFWQKRFEAIRNHENHLAENGTIILKFFLHVSKEEQKRRFLDRIHDQEKNWKFSFGDLRERSHWADYQFAYEEAIRNTATEKAPWFVIPADNKWFMRMAVCDVIVNRLKMLNLSYPEVGAKEKEELKEGLRILESEDN